MPVALEENGCRYVGKLRFWIECEDKLIEELCVEKLRVRLARFDAIARLLRIGRNGDLLPRLDAQLEVSGDPISILPKLFCCRRSVKRGVIAECAKQRFAIVEVLAIPA
jgi:hypothetical protein